MSPVRILQITTLLAAGASLILSVYLYFSNDGAMEDRLNGIFVGTWVPSILALGAFLVASQRRGN
jgi:hypothetical protein